MPRAAARAVAGDVRRDAYYAEIAGMLRNMPRDWHRQYRSGRDKLAFSGGPVLPDKPTPEQAMGLIGITAGGNPSGDTPWGPHKVPKAVREAAMHGIRLSYEHNYGAWDFIGLARAIELVIVPSVSETTYSRMGRYLFRHKKDARASGFGDDENPSRGYMAWLNWGGNPAVEWTRAFEKNPRKETYLEGVERREKRKGKAERTFDTAQTVGSAALLGAKLGGRAIPVVGEVLMVAGAGKEAYKVGKRRLKGGGGSWKTDVKKIGAGAFGLESFVPDRAPKKVPEAKKNPSRRRNPSGTVAGLDLDALADEFTEKMANGTTAQMRRWAKPYGLKYLGEGESRAVFALPDESLVVKFVFSYYGAEGNRNEARAWREASPSIRKHLVPIVAADPDGRWIVMEKVKTMRANQYAEKEALASLQGCGFLDFGRPNFSSDGRMLDYGQHLWFRWTDECRGTPNPRRRNPSSKPVEERLQAFFKDFDAQTVPCPFDKQARMFPDVPVSIILEDGEVYATIAFLQSHPGIRASGAGTEAMRRILDLADKHGVRLFLDPVPLDKGWSWERLVRWYASFGFVFEEPDEEEREASGLYSMLREPGAKGARRPNPRRSATTAERTDPALWEAVKREVTAGSKGGRPGQWSARKAQLAVALYKQRGGDYWGAKSPQNALTKWTREDWRTRSGKPSLVTGERYLPARAIEALSSAEYAATTRAKREGMRRGEQFTPQPERIAAKTARYRKNPSRREADAMRVIRASLTPDLLAGQYRACATEHPMAGHCAVATEALYFMLGGKAAGYTPMNVRHEGVSHWYLRTPEGDYLDPTADQFDTPVDYAAGRGRGFPTPRQGRREQPPSKRAETLLRRVTRR